MNMDAVFFPANQIYGKGYRNLTCFLVDFTENQKYNK